MDITRPAVQLAGITKSFPGVVANDSVNLEVATGTIHALLGENGAGKSTICSILTGLYQPDAGDIRIFGVPRVLDPATALKVGIGMVHQHFLLADAMTVAENIILGDQDGPGSRTVLNHTEINKEVQQLGKRYSLPVDPTAKVGDLPVGLKQRVEILKLLHKGTRIMILDEPTAVLTPHEAHKLFVTLRQMVESESRTVIFISHKLAEVEAVADAVTVMRRGKAVASVASKQVSRAELVRLMVGQDIPPVRRKCREIGGPVVLEVNNLQATDARGHQSVQGVTFQLRRGEIVGLAGVAGNGQRELADAITGNIPANGQVIAVGKPLKKGSPKAAIRAGVAYVPEDRLMMGVASGMSVGSNAVLKAFGKLSLGPLLRPRRMNRQAQEIVEQVRVDTPNLTLPTKQLSGGNVQKLLLGREFRGQPKVLVVATPTRGLDAAAVQFVHQYLRQASESGAAVLLISEDLDEILALADRVLVISRGRIVDELDPSIVKPEDIGRAMMVAK